MLEVRAVVMISGWNSCQQALGKKGKRRKKKGQPGLRTSTEVDELRTIPGMELGPM